MATLTVYPDPDPESTSVDGEVFRRDVSEAWATIRTSTGTGAGPSDTSNAILWMDKFNSSWRHFHRAVYLFDTSSLDDTATISAATLSIFAAGTKDDTLGVVPAIRLVSHSPASNTNLVAGDYPFAQFGTTSFGEITWANWVGTAASENSVTLNASGLTNISKTAVSKFGVLFSNDMDNSEPAGTTARTVIDAYFADQTGTTNDPKLVITYSLGGSTTTHRRMLMGVGQ